MTEQLHFSELWPHWPELLAGLWVTVQLTVLATIGGLAIGILGAAEDFLGLKLFRRRNRSLLL
ncbi:hypothetical protein ACLBO4_21445, partial [Klebsiella pneumoniae]